LKEKKFKILVSNESENTTFQSLWDKVLKLKFVRTYIKKSGKLQTMTKNATLALRKNKNNSNPKLVKGKK
jgi:hypothetical protein